MKQSLDMIEKQILDAMNGMAQKEALFSSKKKGREITQLIKETLRATGKQNGCLVCPDPVDLNKEWLYDIVWYKEVNEKGMHVNLIAESELSYSPFQLKYDFEKLLIANSKIKKVFVCLQGKKKFSDLIDSLQNIADNCPNFEVGDDVLVLVGDDCYEGNFSSVKIIKN